MCDNIKDCYNCKYENSQSCEGCESGYLDYIDGWVTFDQPTHWEEKKQGV